jgi:prophage maintenance system killer protein
MSVYNLKDMIRINQEIGETGELRNGSSLEFALSMNKYNKSWLYKLCYLIRSILVDHPFIDGNKRTAFVLCTIIFEDNNLNYNKDKLVIQLHMVAKKSITDLNKIARMLLKC